MGFYHRPHGIRREFCQVHHSMFSLFLCVAAFFIQEYVNDRVKKIGGMTSFNLYIMKELEVLYKLLVEIKTTLQVRIIMYECISLVI